jgi:NitT/TauT family transport system ATP-binding protein
MRNRVPARVAELSSQIAHTAPQAKLRVRDVSVVYGDQVIIDHVSLEIAPSTVLCLIGSSGCGKTTLLHAMAGLVQCAEGSIEVDARPVAGPGSDRVMVFQDDAVFPWMTVRRNVEYGLRVQSIPSTRRRSAVDEFLKMVRLEGYEDAYPRQLSGGMRKRVDLARALAVEPEVLLMDEPYAALDALTKEQLQLEFLRIKERTGATAIFVTHDLEEALFLGDRVAVLARDPGRIHAILDVPFSHPRSLAIKRTPEFQAYRGELIQLLEETGISELASEEGADASALSGQEAGLPPTDP